MWCGALYLLGKGEGPGIRVGSDRSVIKLEKVFNWH